ncbi:NlpC/P60 family protein [Actinoplanes sp. KI2]|uniref:C40 family peptidase n=1 Tax=Actinoplanes sp. KI2 TaxID=2983315 RepID=UPI0021D602FF|nr:C40 family peptidase [Actinoplanes sp. KI2]MCU7728619.1 NlpC/P60 family protein [Actinoplanes sp. KI2]
MKRIGARRAAVLRSIVCAVAAAGLVLTGPSVAHATPSQSSIEAQIDKQWNQLEPVIEEYNDVHGKLLKNQAQLKKLTSQIGPLQLQVDVALSQVRSMAVDAYMQGAPNAFSAMLMSGSPTGLTDKLMYLDQLSRHQQDQIAGVAKLRDKYAGMKSDLDTLTQSIAARDAQLSQQKNAIQKKIDALQKLRIQAYGANGGDDGNYRLGACPATYTPDKGNRAAQKACSLIGKPYVFGDDGPGAYDCSGLTKAAWATVGVTLDHYTKDQYAETKSISRAELQPGDLVFFFPPTLHHVGIYVGNGFVVHAPHTGDHVRMAIMDKVGTIAGFRRPG